MLKKYLLAGYRRLPMALFVAAVPLLLICASVTWAVNEIRLYEHGFDTYDVPLVTGIERDDLVAASKEIRGYFNSTREPLEIHTRVYGEEMELFNRREVLHMSDVKRLIWGVYAVGTAAALYILGFLGLGFYLKRGDVGLAAERGALWGGELTVGVVVLVGLLAVTGFDSLFLFFHEVSFSNDFWKLDPRKDFLVMMFPQGFWFDATMFVALVTVGLALLLVGSVAALRLVRGWRERRRPASHHPA